MRKRVGSERARRDFKVDDMDQKEFSLSGDLTGFEQQVFQLELCHIAPKQPRSLSDSKCRKKALLNVIAYNLHPLE